ncbi:hypothetical protein Ttaiw_01160 [Tepidimonas taiwanensis]|uniref:Uncharacterized protein n=1 Tax=Tepidimonas taiwanensis TaxID=307486 RepID=A0A554X9B4_9BURK|nr:hypothetical protein Ttaiw_01160 [Tepidimonas taiwanensis]
MFLRYVLPVLLLSPIVDARGELLGDASGRVLLGRPLDIVVQSSSSSLLGGRQGCVQAKVRYGDVPVPDADVQVSIETPSERGAGQGRIRVRVKRPLDEPFVSLTVAVGCGGQEGVFRREWVLLADWPASVGGARRRRNETAVRCCMGLSLRRVPACWPALSRWRNQRVRTVAALVRPQSFVATPHAKPRRWFAQCRRWSGASAGILIQRTSRLQTLRV